MFAFFSSLNRKIGNKKLGDRGLSIHDPDRPKITLHQQKSLVLIWTVKGVIWRNCPSSNLLGTGEEINGLKELANNPIVHWPALVSRRISDMTDIISK